MSKQRHHCFTLSTILASTLRAEHNTASEAVDWEVVYDILWPRGAHGDHTGSP